MTDLARWRTGRKVGRTLYRIVGDEPSDDDVLIGLMDTRALARDVVVAHNLFVGTKALDLMADP